MSSPLPGWTLADAVRLVEQRYTGEQVQRLTGWAAPHVRAAGTAAAVSASTCN